MGDPGAEALAAALARPGCRLRALDLTCSGVTGRGARALALALRGNRRLERLRVLAVAVGRGEEPELAALERAACRRSVRCGECRVCPRRSDAIQIASTAGYDSSSLRADMRMGFLL